MRKRTIAIIMFVSAFISLLLLLLTYFGITRWFTISTISAPEKFVDNYPKLDKADEENRVVIVMYSNKSKTELNSVLSSLLDQTVKVDEICIYRKSKNPKLSQLVSVYDGYDNEIIPCMNKEGEKNTKIIILNDDKIYGKDFIEKLVDFSNENPKNPIKWKEKIVVVKPEFFYTKMDKDLENNLKFPPVSMRYRENF